MSDDEIAQILENDVLKPVGERLVRDVPGSLGRVMHEVGDGFKGIADRTDETEATLKDLIHGTGATGAVSGAEHDITTNAESTLTHDAGALGGYGRIEDPTLRGGSADPTGTATPQALRVTCKDPIDVTSGEMVLASTDVDLPGVLPLVLRRVHVSSYRAGRLFGPSWASTLDQRLELDGEGVCFAAEDGVILVYPVPEPGVPVLPVEGPRWPLTWDGRAGGAMTVHDPQEGITRTFAPAKGHAGDLPIAEIRDRNGNHVTFDYDDDGTLTQLRHSGGYRLGVETDDGLVTCLRLYGDVSAYESALADGSDGLPLVRFAYDGWLDLVEVRNSSGRPTVYSYEAHRITSWTDRNSTSYRYTYDHSGRVVHTAGSDGILSGTLQYDPVRRITVSTDSLGHQTIYRHDEHRHLTSETNPLGHTTHTVYDRYGRLLSRTDPLGHTTAYGYDDAGNLTDVARPDGTSVSVLYNELCRPTQVTEPDGARWTLEHDQRGNLVTVTDPVGARTSYGYDDVGFLRRITDPVGAARSIEVDPAGLPIAVTGPDGATVRYERDGFGRVVTTTDPLGEATHTRWNVQGKPTWRQSPDGSTTSWTYDAEGNLREQRDQIGAVTVFEPGRFDLPAARTDPSGARYTFGYDTELRLTSVTNPRGLVWSYAYDPAGNLTSETDFNGRALTYAYDAADRLIARTNGVGQTARFTRDGLRRVVEQLNDDGVATGFVYDAAGRLVRAVNPDAELTCELDPLGRLLAETVNGRTTRYGYDAAGRPTSRSTPSGAESHWHYDASGRPTRLETGAEILEFGYDEAGREATRRIGRGLELAQQWDSADRLTRQMLSAFDAEMDGSRTRLLQERSYAYRPDGQLTDVRDLIRGPHSLELDAAGRVTVVEAATWRETYAYDATGNPVRAEAALQNPETLGERRYEGSLIREAGRTHYEHDGQGRLIRKVERLLTGGRRVWTYTWDVDDRLIEATTPQGDRWRYRYDALGRRIAKTRLDGGGNTLDHIAFAWDGSHLAEQTRTTETGTRTTTWDRHPDNGAPLTQSEHSPQDEIDQRFYAIVTDLVGAPAELVTPDGDIPWRAEHALWGATLDRSTDRAECPLRFPGQYHDPETGLHYNYFRYYDPDTARYASADPLGLTPAPDPHAYVPNPTAWIDPLGLTECDRCVYRNLRDDEDPALGLTAKNPAATYKPAYHVTSGSRPGVKTQFISTTRSLDVAKKWTAGRMVKIDLTKVGSPVVDLSTDAARAAAGVTGHTAVRLSRSSAEVLIVGRVPPEAITWVTGGPT